MARSFTASTDYFLAAGLPITAYPVTIACWYNSTDDGGGRVLCALNNPTNNDRLQIATAWNVAGDPLRAAAFLNSGSGSAASSTSAMTTSTWQHACAVFTSTTSRTIYLNGANSATDTTSVAVTISGLTSFYIGKSRAGSPANASIAGIGIWDAALTAAEAQALAQGVSPLSVRPSALVAYYPLVGNATDEPDYVGGFTAAQSGSTPKADQPRIFLPSAQILQFPSAAGGSSLNVSATTDTLVIAEQAATIGLSKNVSASTDTLVITEFAATVGSALDVQATTDSLVISEQAATIGLAINVQAGTDSLVITEYPASLGSTQNVSATTDTLVITEQPATIGLALNVQATSQALVITEYGALITDSTVVETPAPAGGIGHKRKRVMVDGIVYAVTPSQERQLLRDMAAQREADALMAAALGDQELAKVIQPKVTRLAKRVAKIDRLERLRKEDEEILLQFILRVA